MSLFRAWPLLAAMALFTSFACTSGSMPASETRGEPRVEASSQALAGESCSREQHRDLLTWSSRRAGDEACTGAFAYVRQHRCRQECGRICTNRPPCANWSYSNLRGPDRVVRATRTLRDLPKTCRRLGFGGVELCLPDNDTALTRCNQVANTDLADEPELRGSPYPGRFDPAPAVSEVQSTGERTFQATCRYTMVIPTPRVRYDSRCPCIADAPLMCDRVCSTSGAVTAPGLTYDEAEALMLDDPEHGRFDPIESIDDAQLRCTTCDDLPLPDAAASFEDVPYDLRESQVRARYACLGQQRARLPANGPEAALVDRTKLWVYEGWGHFLTEAQAAESDALYASFEALPGVDYCAPHAETPVLPASCPAAEASALNADLRRCQRLAGDHADTVLQGREYWSCRDAFHRMMATPACRSVEYGDLMAAAIQAIWNTNSFVRPLWEARRGSNVTGARLEGEEWVDETVVGAAPPGYTCPAPEPGSGWVGGLMFGDRPLSEQPVGEDGSLFCRYRYTGTEPSSLAWLTLPSQFQRCALPGGGICNGTDGQGNIEFEGPQWLRPDAKVVSTQAPGALGEMQARLASEYLANMDAPLVGAAVADEHKVDLAILDSVGDSALDDALPLPGSGHGRAISVAAFRAACPQGEGASCPINFRNYQAFQPGTVASLSDLAAKIVMAVDDARLRNARLVINISLGLHPRFAWWDQPAQGESGQGVLLPAFSALKAALNYASAHGAITIAAAGNTDGASAEVPEGDAEELLYPAAFDGASGWRCNALRECAAETRPLVIAAGGVTADNQPLPNARFPGRPVSFVAPACNVAVNNQLPWEPAGRPDLPTYCGTSFGAIGVSTVLAATWAHLPDATPEQLLGVVRGAGFDTADGTTGCTGDGCRVRLCASLQAAGAAVGCGVASAPPPVGSGVQAFLDAHEVDVTWSGEGASEPLDVSCGTDVLFAAGAPRSSDACPARNFQSSLPDSGILLDQPGDPQCPQCGIALMNTQFGFVIPVFMGTVQPAVNETISAQSLGFLSRTYELESTLAPFFQHGGSFAVRLSAINASPPATSVASFSYLRLPVGATRATLQLDPVPVLP